MKALRDEIFEFQLHYVARCCVDVKFTVLRVSVGHIGRIGLYHLLSIGGNHTLWRTWCHRRMRWHIGRCRVC